VRALEKDSLTVLNIPEISFQKKYPEIYMAGVI
jgi:hypothetical protein